MEFIFMGSGRRSARVAAPSFGANFQTGMSALRHLSLELSSYTKPSLPPPRPAVRPSVYNISSV